MGWFYEKVPVFEMIYFSPKFENSRVCLKSNSNFSVALSSLTLLQLSAGFVLTLPVSKFGLMNCWLFSR